MSLSFLIYLADIVGPIQFTFILLVTSSWIAFIFYVGYLAETNKLKEFKKWTLCFCLTLSLVTPIIPSKQAIYMMAGASIGKDLIESETAKKIKSIIDVKLDDYYKEVTKK